MYSLLYREYVSQGYIVFAIDHHDGSCNYTQLEDGTEKYFNTSKDFYDHQFRRAGVQTREREVIDLLNEL